MARDRFYLSKKGGTNWRLERANPNRAPVKAPTKAEAIEKIREYMKKHEGTVRIHKMDGTVQQERTYSRARIPGGQRDSQWQCSNC